MKSGDRKSFPGTQKTGHPASARAAAELAGEALTFLAADAERLERFFALTGVDPSDVRGLVGTRGFSLAVLDHVAQDEQCLLQFASAAGIAPEAVGAARRALGGGDY